MNPFKGKFDIVREESRIIYQSFTIIAVRLAISIVEVTLP